MKRLRAILCALLAGVVLLSGCGAGVISTVGETRDTGDPKYVALTFDDGPSPRCTPRLLDGLREMGAKATFFVVGCQAVKDPDIVQRIAAEGHQVCYKSYDHADLHSLTAAQALADLEKNDALLRELHRFAPDAPLRPDTIYFGGGTPSLLGSKRLRQLLTALEKTVSNPSTGADTAPVAGLLTLLTSAGLILSLTGKKRQLQK